MTASIYYVCTFSAPEGPLRKKFHSALEIRSACLKISPHNIKEKTSLSFSNRPLQEIQKETLKIQYVTIHEASN